ncbi:hypothetical protein J3F84DRAFT_383559 [Trichoderma pleuroticola]
MWDGSACLMHGFPSCLYGFSLNRCKLLHPTHVIISLSTRPRHPISIITSILLIYITTTPAFLSIITYSATTFHRFRPSSTAGKRKEYHFSNSFDYLIITGLHWRFIIFPSFFPSPWNFIHWLHRD